jgi:hypothetical protein
MHLEEGPLAIGALVVALASWVWPLRLQPVAVDVGPKHATAEVVESFSAAVCPAAAVECRCLCEPPSFELALTFKLALAGTLLLVIGIALGFVLAKCCCTCDRRSPQLSIENRPFSPEKGKSGFKGIYGV